jgi:hypothetical protein
MTGFISSFTGFDFQNFIKAGVIKGAPTASDGEGRKESNVAYRQVAKW